MKLQPLLAELKRRRVFHVAAVYGAVAFVIAQVADIAFPALLLPSWTLTLVIVLLLLGFPLALVLAWAFDLTPEGLQRTEALPSTPAPAESSDGVGRWRTGRIAFAGGLLILAGAGVAFAFLRGDGAGLNQRRVLVAVFENQTGNPSLDPIGRMAADWIARGLMETRSIEVVPLSAMLHAARRSDELGVRGMAREAGAGTVVSGTYYLEGGILRLQVQVADAAHGRLLHTLEPVSVPVDSATAGAELLRQRVAAALAARFDWPQELTILTRRSDPPTYAAYAEFVDGWELFSRGEVSAALAAFQRAWELDTTFHLPRLYASLMYWNLDDLPRMDSVLREVALHREQLPGFDRVLLEHFQAIPAGDNETALRTARQMNQMAPGSTAVGQAVFALRTNRPREALAALRQEKTMLRQWLGYSPVATSAWHMLGDHRRELQEARQGRGQHAELRSLLLTELRALAAQGQVAEVERLLDESLFLPPQPGWTAAGVIREAATELRAHGHEQAATRVVEKALAWYRSRTLVEQRSDRSALASLLYDAQRWEEARVLFEELAAEQPDAIEHLGHLGTLAARRGERAEAERISAKLASSTQPYLLGAHTLWRARIAAQLGEHEQAMLLLREALAQGQPYGLWLHTDPDLDPLREQRAFRELMRPKG
jgi:tetratricopeptide (TPR) repeat protein